MVLSKIGVTLAPVLTELVASLVQYTANDEPPADFKDSCATFAPLPHPEFTAALPKITSVVNESVNSPASFTCIVKLLSPDGVPVTVISPVTLSMLNWFPAG